MMQHHIIVRRQSEHAYHNSIRHFFVIHSLKEVLTEKEVKAGKDLHWHYPSANPDRTHYTYICMLD